MFENSLSRLIDGLVLLVTVAFEILAAGAFVAWFLGR
jgi:hypothetical protein